MGEFFSRSHFETAAETIRAETEIRLRVGIILGSGLNPLAAAVEDAVAIPYDRIAYYPATTVMGHTGRLVVGWLEGQAVIVMQGRPHFYEGYSMAEVTFPVRVMQVLGIKILVVTNAAGGLNPLRGPNLDAFGPRFPDMSEAYDPRLRAAARQAAAEAEVPLREGVYICLSGPSYETPADLRFLRQIGADAVGMSTVPEVVVARHGSTRVLGLSGISNVLPGGEAPPVETTHEEVLETGRVLAPRMESIIRGVLRTV